MAVKNQQMEIMNSHAVKGFVMWRRQAEIFNWNM